MEFFKKIEPFYWVEHEECFCVCLEVGDYKAELFNTRSDEGFEGNGYDWESLAIAFLNEKMPEALDIVNFDPEAELFCAYSEDEQMLRKFALEFKSICEDDKELKDIFSKAEVM
ncbi:MAG: Imm51 family immunity protein [Eubacteriales bacterium]|nr:Imm51 family immunity protein [Eubacteriales bacterium]MDD4475033.1 Imm51 family immunity protein [Eubacteriales bacterium]